VDATGKSLKIVSFKPAADSNVVSLEEKRDEKKEAHHGWWWDAVHK
jgi:hypothetical protein